MREHARGRNNPQKKLPNSQLPELTEGEMQIRKIFLAAQSQELFSIYVRARKRERVKLGFSFCFSLLLLDSIAAASFFCLFFTSLTLFAFASLFYFSFFLRQMYELFYEVSCCFFLYFSTNRRKNGTLSKAREGDDERGSACPSSFAFAFSPPVHMYLAEQKLLHRTHTRVHA